MGFRRSHLGHSCALSAAVFNGNAPGDEGPHTGESGRLRRPQRLVFAQVSARATRLLPRPSKK